VTKIRDRIYELLYLDKKYFEQYEIPASEGEKLSPYDKAYKTQMSVE